MNRAITSGGFIFLLLFSSLLYAESRELELKSGDDIEIPITIYTADSPLRMLWLPAESGIKTADHEQARALAALGIEVWVVDLHAAHFLPTTQSSMDKMDGALVKQVIDAASRDSKKVVLFSPGRGAIPLLRGLKRWHKTATTAIPSVILLHPKLYRPGVEPGKPAELMPIVAQTNASLYIIQPKLSPWFWRIKATVASFESANSDVFIESIADVRDRFYFRPDAVVYEAKKARQLAKILFRAAYRLMFINKQRQYRHGPEVFTRIKEGKSDRSLKNYAGNQVPPVLRLHDMNNRLHNIADYRGKVVLVNFWASWCPPCVHEMPSMQRLYESHSRDDFEILAVNMAEPRAEISAFLKSKVAVTFPVLLDTNGDTLKSWKVFAFPSSYVLDRQGKIIYGVYGGVDWMSADIEQKIAKLLAE
ncbi:MAG: TlpA family protein disulfide reductase [Gammaproteobacteria bacterium]|nr:TlpA family protein disulfide reductase [Gammaproteobacteria bacterium]